MTYKVNIAGCRGQGPTIAAAFRCALLDMPSLWAERIQPETVELARVDRAEDDDADVNIDIVLARGSLARYMLEAYDGLLCDLRHLSLVIRDSRMTSRVLREFDLVTLADYAEHLRGELYAQFEAEDFVAQDAKESDGE